jgi:nitrogen regulatory protein PII
MKLLIITSISEFEKEIKQMLVKANVKNFSYKEVIGYHNTSDEAIGDNWFATEMNENESILFYAFVPSENVEMVFNAINEFNGKQETLSKIHVATVNIENSN